MLLLLPREEGASFSVETATAAVVKLLLPHLVVRVTVGVFCFVFFYSFSRHQEVLVLVGPRLHSPSSGDQKRILCCDPSVIWRMGESVSDLLL